MRKILMIVLCLMMIPVWALAENPAPVQEYVDLLESHGVDLSMVDMTLYKKDVHDWYSCSIAKFMTVTYDVYHDGSRDTLMLQAPDTWRPQRDAFLLLLEYMLGMDADEAESTLARLEYNVISNTSEIVTDDYKISYMEANTFCSLTVTRYPAP